MTQKLPRAFVALLVAVLLLCSAAVAFSVFHQHSLSAQIAKAQADLETIQGRLRKQAFEYAQYQAELPVVLAELAEVQPQAEAIYEQEQALRQQRKEIRQENADLAAELAGLQERADDASTETSRTAEAVARLLEALTALESIAELYQ